MTAIAPQFTLSEDLLREIEDAARETALSYEDLLRASVRTYVQEERRWREVQEEVSQRAKAMGLHTEEDIEAFLDALDEQTA